LLRSFPCSSAYLIAAALLAAFVFILRVMGAAAEIEHKHIMPLYLIGGFSSIVLAVQYVLGIQAPEWCRGSPYRPSPRNCAT
jgi:hypothetical protein